MAPTIIATVDMPAQRNRSMWSMASRMSPPPRHVVVDVRTPSRPVIAGSIAATVTNVAVITNTVYAWEGINFRSLMSVRFFASIAEPTSSYGAQGLDVLGSQVYLASRVNTFPSPTSKGGLYVIDVTSLRTRWFSPTSTTGSRTSGLPLTGNWPLRLGELGLRC